MSKIESISSLEDFWQEISKSLVLEEIKNSLILGVARKALASKTKTDSPLLLGRSTGENPVYFLKMPGSRLLLSSGWTAPQLQSLVDHFGAGRVDVLGFVCEAGPAETLRNLWDREPSAIIRQRLYSMSQIGPMPQVAGSFRQARAEDWPVLEKWTLGFVHAALRHERIPLEQYLQAMEKKLAAGMAFVWEKDGRLVSWAGIAAATEFGVRIAPVFTPEEERGRGYASAVTWALSRELLKGNRRYVCLFADIDNPTSNSIYKKIGYVAHCDFENVTY